jgi:hypothetical protein
VVIVEQKISSSSASEAESVCEKAETDADLPDEEEEGIIIS